MRRFVPLLSCLVSVLLVPAASARVSGEVAALQVALSATRDYSGAVDGILGPGTRGAVTRFQRRHGLTPDGVAGPATRRKLGRRGRPRWGTRAISSGDAGWDVARLQFELARHGFPSGGADGGFGPRGVGALQRFQAFAGLAVDGVAGPSVRAALRRPPPQSPLKFYRPVGGPIGDHFGPRGTGWHPGLDYPVASGTPVGAAGYGRVSYAGYDAGGYGNLVIIQHRKGVTTMYAHLSSINVSEGERVVGRDRVGRVGSTGFSTGPHLHFEIRVRGAAVDPARAFL